MKPKNYHHQFGSVSTDAPWGAALREGGLEIDDAPEKHLRRVRGACADLRAEGYRLFARESAYLLFGRVGQDALGCPTLRVRAVAWTWGEGGEDEEFDLPTLAQTLADESLRIVRGREDLALLAALEAVRKAAEGDDEVPAYVRDLGRFLVEKGWRVA